MDTDTLGCDQGPTNHTFLVDLWNRQSAFHRDLQKNPLLNVAKKLSKLIGGN